VVRVSDGEELDGEELDGETRTDVDASPEPTDPSAVPELGTGPWIKVLIAVAVVVLVGLIGLAVVAITGDDGSGAPIVLDDAVDAQVLLPGGAAAVPVAARPGMEVPDGSRIVTGSDGHVRADGVEMGPQRAGKVVDGRLVVLPPVDG
jgi:hypothetical protein